MLARQISMMQDHKLKRLFVIGGDGTMHEVINGLKGTDQIELTFVPAGSYNDFSKGLGIKKSALLQEIKVCTARSHGNCLRETSTFS